MASSTTKFTIIYSEGDLEDINGQLPRTGDKRKSGQIFIGRLSQCFTNPWACRKSSFGMGR